MSPRIDEVQLTAFALGELEGEERAAIEQLLAGDTEAQRAVEEIRQTAGMLERGLAAQLSEAPAASWPTPMGGDGVTDHQPWALALPVDRGRSRTSCPPRHSDVLSSAGSARPEVPNNLASRSVLESARALEIKTIWGETVLDTLSATTEPLIEMGDEARTTGWGPFQKIDRPALELPAGALPVRRYPLLVSESNRGASYLVHIHDSFGGWLELADGTRREIAEVRAGAYPDLETAQIPGVVRYRIEAEETLVLVHGAMRIQLRYVRKVPAPPARSLLEHAGSAWINALLLVFVLHSVAIASFTSVPRYQEELTETLAKAGGHFGQAKLIAARSKAAPAKTDFLDAIKHEKSSRGTQTLGAEGRVGTHDPKSAPPKGSHPSNREVAQNGLTKLFTRRHGVPAAGSILGDGGLGDELEGALGEVHGRLLGDSSGLSGLSTRGLGPGGSGSGGLREVGLGALGSPARDLGGSIGELPVKREHALVVSEDAPVIMGALDRELIRRVIDAHKAQVAYCYETELSKTPDLFGKISLEWTIDAEGKVSSARLRESTMGVAVGRCVVERIKSWVFPKPRGGGTVTITYPYIFKRSG